MEACSAFLSVNAVTILASTVESKRSQKNGAQLACLQQPDYYTDILMVKAGLYSQRVHSQVERTPCSRCRLPFYQIIDEHLTTDWGSKPSLVSRGRLKLKMQPSQH